MKKRFDDEPRKPLQTYQNRFRASNSDQASDMVNLKRVRFKDPGIGVIHHSSPGFDASSVPCEATEAPQSSSDPKTTEYAAFKKLRQGLSRSSSLKSVDKERIHARKFRPSNNVGEIGDVKLMDAKSSVFAKKSTTGDVHSFMTFNDAAIESSDMTDKVHDDHERSKSSFLIRTPTAIDLDSFLSTSANASAKPERQWNDGDMFSCKRLKLRQQIAKTLFPETGELPKECDLISLLLRRLLPENSEYTLESPNIRLKETKDKSQLCPFPDSNCQFKENWDTSMKAKDSCFLDWGGSFTWSDRFKNRVPSSPTVEGIESSAVRSANKKHLGYQKGTEGESFFNDIDSECWSNRFGDGNLLTWSDKDYDYSSDCWSNRFEDRKLLTWNNEVDDYSTPCNTDTDFLKHEVHDCLSYDGVSEYCPCRVREQTSSCGVPSGSFGCFTANDAKRTNIKYKDESFDCKLDTRAASSTDIWSNSTGDVPYGKSRFSELHNLRDIAEPRYLNDFETRIAPCPLLLGWDTDESDTKESSVTNDMELGIYRPPSSMCSEDHHINLEDRDLLGIHSASFPRQLPWYTYQGHHIQRHHHLEDQNHLILRSRETPLTLPCGVEQREPDDGGFYRNLLRESTFFVLPQIVHHNSAGNMECERNVPSVEALLLFEGTSSDLGMEFKSVACFSENQNHMCTNDVLQLLRRENRSSQFLFENENTLTMSRPEHWPLMDAEAETCNFGSGGTIACDNITW